MRTIVRRALLGALPALLATTAAAQHGGAHAGHQMAMPTSGYRAELIRDVETLEQRYLGLAGAMNGKLTYRPADGVRTAAAVFMHVAGANVMIPMALGIAPPSELGTTDPQAARARIRELEATTDPAHINTALRVSFAHAKHAIATVPDAEMDAQVKMFGRDMTRRAALHLLVSHMHEHLGQSIAYARASGVTPPWSAN